MYNGSLFRIVVLMCCTLCHYRVVLEKMGLEAKVDPKQAKKKWENLKQKYKVCDTFQLQLIVLMIFHPFRPEAVLNPIQNVRIVSVVL